MAGRRPQRSTDLPIIWSPQPGPQAKLITCPVFEIFYGGARGGGKTAGMIGRFAVRQDGYGRHCKGIFFRRELPQLEAAIDYAKQVYGPLGAEWQEQKKTFVFPSGATLKFRPLERDSDAEKYQGHDYTDIFFEELTNYPDPAPYQKLKATLRSAAGVPVHMCSTGNPGGPGHHWVKQRFIDPAPQGFCVLTDAEGLQRVFIPAKVSDNQLLLRADPTYVARLKQTGSDSLVRAWLDGDWSVIEGAYFDCWSERMVLRPFEIPTEWTRFRAFDWGSAKPFSVGWWAIVPDDFDAGGQLIPKGALICFREWYGASAPNVGLKLTAEDVAAGIREHEQGETIAYGVADPAIWIADGGPSIAERHIKAGVTWRPADNKRLAGWDQLRQRMVGIDGRPLVYWFSTCADSIRTIPALQHDTAKPEDVDTDGEDHAADQSRYAAMSRPLSRPGVEPPYKPKSQWELRHLLNIADQEDSKRKRI